MHVVQNLLMMITIIKFFWFEGVVYYSFTDSASWFKGVDQYTSWLKGVNCHHLIVIGVMTDKSSIKDCVELRLR